LQKEFDQRVEERTATLSKAHASLEKELNERKQAERSLAMQTKELERSKDVLELHVQARTQELQKLQRRNESILNSAGEGIYGLDLHGKTTFVNPAAATREIERHSEKGFNDLVPMFIVMSAERWLGVHTDV